MANHHQHAKVLTGSIINMEKQSKVSYNTFMAIILKLCLLKAEKQILLKH